MYNKKNCIITWLELCNSSLVHQDLLIATVELWAPNHALNRRFLYLSSVFSTPFCCSPIQ
jgi:hypothetical protein